MGTFYPGKAANPKMAPTNGAVKHHPLGAGGGEGGPLLGTGQGAGAGPSRTSDWPAQEAEWDEESLARQQRGTDAHTESKPDLRTTKLPRSLLQATV